MLVEKEYMLFWQILLYSKIETFQMLYIYIKLIVKRILQSFNLWDIQLILDYLNPMK